MSRIHAGHADKATQRLKKDFSHASCRASLTRQRFWAWRCLEPAAWKFHLNLLVPCPVRRSGRWAVQQQAALAAATDYKHRGRATRAARACSFYLGVTPWNAIATHRDGHRHKQWEDSRPRNDLLSCFSLSPDSTLATFLLFPFFVNCSFRIQNFHRLRHRDKFVYHIFW